MKKSWLALGLAVTVGLIIVISSIGQERSMAFDDELQEALDAINHLQSLSIQYNPNNQSDPDYLKEIGSKLFKIKDAFAHNDDRIKVLELDQQHFENVVTTKLDALFPYNNNILAAVSALKQPAAFVNLFRHYVEIVPRIVARELDVEISALPGEDDPIWKESFEVTKDNREIRARLRGNDWLANYEIQLCTTNDPENDPDSYGEVSMIRFNKDNNQAISHEVLGAHKDVCIHDTDGSVGVQQFICSGNQFRSQASYTACPYGCEDGACLPKPVTLSHFDLYVDQDGIMVDRDGMHNFNLVVVARNSDVAGQNKATDYDGQGLIIVTGDANAEFPQNVDLKLADGVGVFPISLTTFDDVSISFKDVDNHINGSANVRDLREYMPNIISSEADILILGCTNKYAMNYNPKATQYDGTCTYRVYHDGAATNKTVSDTPVSQENVVYGCTHNTAMNDAAGVTAYDGSCEYKDDIDERLPSFDPKEAFSDL